MHGAAFGECPEAEVPGAPGSPAEAWLAAVALGGRGRYAAAAALLRELIPGRDPVLAALAAATLASHRRQVGGHAAARGLDAAGLHRLAAAGLRRGAPVGAAAEARSDVLLGLAADAVGLGRIAEARRLLEAESAVADAGWRAEIRREWVMAETALAAGDAAAAVAPARRASRAAEGSGSRRHRIKSALVLGVALTATGEREESHPLLRGALQGARERGLAPLVWPCALVLADLDPAGADDHRAQARDALHCVLRHSDPVARELAAASPWVPTWLFGPAPNR